MNILENYTVYGEIITAAWLLFCVCCFIKEVMTEPHGGDTNGVIAGALLGGLIAFILWPVVAAVAVVLVGSCFVYLLQQTNKEYCDAD